LPNTDKYSAVFTEYSVAEYSAGHYSAEYSADRIVGRSLLTTRQDPQRLEHQTELIRSEIMDKEKEFAKCSFQVLMRLHHAKEIVKWAVTFHNKNLMISEVEQIFGSSYIALKVNDFGR
jgi:hypothetical protein